MIKFTHICTLVRQETEVHAEQEQPGAAAEPGGHRVPEAQHQVRREGDPGVVQVRGGHTDIGHILKVV